MKIGSITSAPKLHAVASSLAGLSDTAAGGASDEDSLKEERGHLIYIYIYIYMCVCGIQWHPDWDGEPGGACIFFLEKIPLALSKVSLGRIL